MPIDVDRFEDAPEEALQSGEPTNAEAILSFLASNPDEAFTPKEIHLATELPRGSVGVVLSRLETRDLVRHRGVYWAIGTGEDVDRTIAAMGVARADTAHSDPEEPGRAGGHRGGVHGRRRPGKRRIPFRHPRFPDR